MKKKFQDMILYGGSTLAGDASFIVYNSSLTSLVEVHNDGTVGIGTSAPTYKLHVKNGDIALESLTDSFRGNVSVHIPSGANQLSAVGVSGVQFAQRIMRFGESSFYGQNLLLNEYGDVANGFQYIADYYQGYGVNNTVKARLVSDINGVYYSIGKLGVGASPATRFYVQGLTSEDVIATFKNVGLAQTTQLNITSDTGPVTLALNAFNTSANTSGGSKIDFNHIGVNRASIYTNTANSRFWLQSDYDIQAINTTSNNYVFLGGSGISFGINNATALSLLNNGTLVYPNAFGNMILSSVAETDSYNSYFKIIGPNNSTKFYKSDIGFGNWNFGTSNPNVSPWDSTNITFKIADNSGNSGFEITSFGGSSTFLRFKTLNQIQSFVADYANDRMFLNTDFFHVKAITGGITFFQIDLTGAGAGVSKVGLGGIALGSVTANLQIKGTTLDNSTQSFLVQSSNGTNRFEILSAGLTTITGNLGINTPATGFYDMETLNAIKVGGNIYMGNNLQFNNTGFSQIYSGGSYELNYYAAGHHHFVNGNVGINEPSPTTKLHISDLLDNGGVGGTILTLSNTDPSFANNQETRIDFRQGTSDIGRIANFLTSGGNVGGFKIYGYNTFFNTTPILHLRGDGLSGVNTSSVLANWHVQGIAGNNPFRVDDATSSTVALFVQDGGKVGVGTSSPTDLLSVYHTKSSTAKGSDINSINLGGHYSNTAGANPKLKIYDDGNLAGIGISAGQMDYITYASVDHVFYSNGTRLTTIDSAGTLTTAANIKTAQPSGNGAGAWKLGKKITASVTLVTTDYVEVEIDGVVYKLALVN